MCFIEEYLSLNGKIERESKNTIRKTLCMHGAYTVCSEWQEGMRGQKNKTQ